LVTAEDFNPGDSINHMFEGDTDSDLLIDSADVVYIGSADAHHFAKAQQ